MKKLICALAVAAALGSCYSDKGNYDFDLDGMNDFGTLEISPKPSQSNEEQFQYTVKFPQPMGTDSVVYQLKVKLNQTVLEDKPENLEYIWTCSHYNAEDEAVTRTETNDGTLDITFYPNISIAHLGGTFKLRVHDQTTTLDRYFVFTVQPRLTFENSLFVLHGNSDGDHKLGNIAIIDNEVDLVENVMDRINPDTTNFFRNTSHLGGALALRNLSTPWAGIYLWTGNTDGNAYLYNPYSMSTGHLENRDSEILLPTTKITPDTKFTPAWVNQPYSVATDGRMFMVDTYGRLLISSTCGIPSQYNDNYAINSLMLYTPASSDEYTPDGREIPNGEYEFVGVCEDRNAGDMGLIVGYDKMGKRFLYVTVMSAVSNNYAPEAYRKALDKDLATEPVQNTFIDYSVLPSDLKLDANGKEMIFIHGGSVSDPGGVYTYFLDNQNRVYRYELRYCGSGGKTRADSDNSPIYEITGHELTNMKGITKDTPFLFWPNASPTLVFYAIGNTIYRYNTQSDQATVVYEVPGEWTINKLKVKTVSSNGAAHEYIDENGNYAYNQICIGLQNGDKGAVTEIQLLSNGATDESFVPRIYEGFEKILDFYFAYSYKTNELVAQ